jgi:hypothetical protein
MARRIIVGVGRVHQQSTFDATRRRRRLFPSRSILRAVAPPTSMRSRRDAMRAGKLATTARPGCGEAPAQDRSRRDLERHIAHPKRVPHTITSGAMIADLAIDAGRSPHDNTRTERAP